MQLIDFGSNISLYDFSLYFRSITTEEQCEYRVFVYITCRSRVYKAFSISDEVENEIVFLYLFKIPKVN